MKFKWIDEIFRSFDTESPFLPPTQLYNEGWMLRLLMHWFATNGPNCVSSPLSIPNGCQWYSEALLPSPFLPKDKKDKFAESWTHADGVIGDFEIGKENKGGLTLKPEAKHFVVIEAKMYSGLGSGVKNAPYYNQVARTIACMAEVLHRAKRQPSDIDMLGFYVFAPDEKIGSCNFDEYIESLENTVYKRISDYPVTKRNELNHWFEEWFLPTKIELSTKTYSWESLIDSMSKCDRQDLNNFYDRCLHFNKK